MKPAVMPRVIVFVLVAVFALFGAIFNSVPAFAAPETKFVVNTTLTSGFDGTCDATECALAEAIAAANATVARDTINFNIPANADEGCNNVTAVCTLMLTSDMPYVTAPTTINGYSQPGATANTLDVGNDAQLKIEIDGGGFYKALTLDAGADGSLVKGLVFKHSGYELKLISASDVVIEGNFLVWMRMARL